MIDLVPWFKVNRGGGEEPRLRPLRGDLGGQIIENSTASRCIVFLARFQRRAKHSLNVPEFFDAGRYLRQPSFCEVLHFGAGGSVENFCDVLEGEARGLGGPNKAHRQQSGGLANLMSVAMTASSQLRTYCRRSWRGLAPSARFPRISTVAASGAHFRGRRKQ